MADDIASASRVVDAYWARHGRTVTVTLTTATAAVPADRASAQHHAGHEDGNAASDGGS